MKNPYTNPISTARIRHGSSVQRSLAKKAGRSVIYMTMGAAQLGKEKIGVDQCTSYWAGSVSEIGCFEGCIRCVLTVCA